MALISILKLILPIIATILTYNILMLSFKDNKIKRFNKITNEIMEIGLKKNSKGYFSHSKIEEYLNKNGATFMFANITPANFILTKIMFALLLGLIGVTENMLLLAIALATLGFFLPDIAINVSNSEDNNKILLDLKRVYDTLRIQTKAGVFLTSALAECYLVAKNKRFKQALLELNNEIISKNDIETSMEKFNSKFNNPYINTFCIVIKQSLSSGKTVQILDDLSAQIKDIQQAIAIKEAEKVKSKLSMLQFAIYIGVIAIIVYGIFAELMSSLIQF